MQIASHSAFPRKLGTIMSWDDTRIFLALTRAPSLRAAARSLGVDQATVGRRLNALEA